VDAQQELAVANLRRLKKLADRLAEARVLLGEHFPLDPDTFDPDALDPALSLAIDGFRGRVAALQDFLGKSVFRTIALLDEDESPGRALTTRERNALMEKRGLIDGDAWRDAREVRNRFAHEYPDAHQEKAANLNAAWSHVPALQAVVARIETYLADRHGLQA
jgi:hypothetical protein